MNRIYAFAVIAAILLAVLLPLANAHHAQREALSYPAISVDIEPYDPRDLLYGHYLLFRIDWNLPKSAKNEPQACNGAACCLCLGKGDANPSAKILTCEAAKREGACTHFVRGKANGSEFFSGLDRFYVDENYGYPLERVFRDKKETFRLELSMRPGAPVIRELYIGNRPYRTYVAQEGAKLRQPPTP